MIHPIFPRRSLFFKFFLFFFSCQVAVFAQLATKQKTKTKQYNSPIINSKTVKVPVSMSGRTFSDILPFDEPFLLVGNKGANDKITIDRLISIECFYKIKERKESFPDSAEQEDFRLDKVYKGGYSLWENNGTDTEFSLAINPLDPNKEFSFFFKIRRKLSESETTKLVNYASRIIPPLIAAQLKDHFVAISIADAKKMTEQIINSLAEEMYKTGQTIEVANLNSTVAKVSSVGIAEIGYAFQSSDEELQSIDFNISTLKADISDLQKFLVDYNANGNDAKKAANIKAIENVVALIKLIYTHPKDANASNDELRKGYLEQVNSFIDELKKVDLPSDSPYEKIKASLIDHVGDLVANFNEYTVSLTSKNNTIKTQVDNLIAAVVAYIDDAIVVNGTSINSDFETRSNSFLTADLGVALMPSIGKMVPYLGTNIYLRPVNQNRPLLMKEFIYKDFWRRFSLMLGLTYSTIAKANYRADLMSTFNLITGAGLRVADFVKVNGGLVWYTQINPNPLNTNNSIKGSGFVSLSFDIHIKTVFHKLFSADAVKIP